MRTWVKVLLGALVLFGALAALLALLLLRTGKWDQVRQFSGGMIQLTQGAQVLEKYEKAHPFKIPADGRIAPERLEAYLDVCAALKPFEEPYRSWMAEHMGRKGDFKDAAQAVAFMGQMAGILQRELGARQMSTREFAWTHAAVREARKELTRRSGSPRAAEILGLLRRTAQDPELPPRIRARLSAELARLDASGEAHPSENALVLEPRLDRLAEVDPGDLADLFLGGVAQGTRPVRMPQGGDGPAR